MLECTINSQVLNRKITFSRPGLHYVYADFNGEPGCLGVQICDGGRLRGNTVMYSGNSEQEFKRVCHKWYRAHLRGVWR